MRITAVETILLTGPSSNDPWITFAKQTRTVALVRVTSDSGLTGIGETYCGYFAPELVDPVVELIRPILTEGDGTDPVTLGERIRLCLGYAARVGVVRAAIGAVEAALWDLRGKAEGVPAYQLLGGLQHQRLPAYATGGPSPWPAEFLLQKAERYAELGFTALKVATGGMDQQTRRDLPVPGGRDAAPEWEVEKLRLLRDRLGPEFGLLLDGHMGGGRSEVWDLELATRVLRAIEEFDPILVEEPLPYTDPDAYAELRRRTSIPIAGGEQLSSAAEFALWLDRDAFGVAQPDAAWLSPSEFLTVAANAAARGTLIASHNWCGGAGVMQNVHCAFACANTLIVELLPDAGPLHTRLWGDQLVIEDGQLLPPTAPGFGVRVDDRLLADFPYRKGHEEFVSMPGKVLRT
ncbi:mandelate racemase/muconate lactonizing enzyme family protein [Enemella evansiae]|uniref:mandelate racemase/muconate lactonizing enzyme family protein n=1 Tax=Enemella evansiae TaxID=2016499 RepID=UPI000B9695C7|nr:mandelate racemase/muconate lactonizing enzyme family protein [Enemella evansiae]OYO05486.1 hypothetical protein CGZ97_01820 [Enemella evansiae]